MSTTESRPAALLMESALRWLAEATPGSAEMLRLMECYTYPVRGLRGHLEAF